MIDYKSVRKLGEKQYNKAISKGWHPYLPALDDMLNGVETAGEIYLGTHEIPVHMIAGTKSSDRQNAFSYGFLPLLEAGSEFATKWVSLYQVQMNTGFTDPIKVYEYMNCFYVLEGNKRVSVMKYLNGDSIMANVTRIIPKRTEDRDVAIYYEFMDFYQVTGMYGITFSELGCYERLAQIMQQNLKDPWNEKAVLFLRNCFISFGVTLARCAEKLPGWDQFTAGDAFLIYLNVYKASSLLDLPSSVLEERVKKLWKEFQVGVRQDELDIVDTPAESSDKKTNLWKLLLRGGNDYSERKPLLVSFVHEKNPDASSWTNAHEIGRKKVDEFYKEIVHTEAYYDCNTDEATREAIDRAVANGAGVIFTTSSPLMEETFRSAIHYPKVHFINCSVKLKHQAVRTYDARMYEAKFILGAIAASLSENHRLGYRADIPVYGTIASINAFAAGAAMVDPKCEIYLAWSSKENSDWRSEVRTQQVDIISGRDMTSRSNPTDEFGIYRFEEDGKLIRLAEPVMNWGRYYELIIHTILNGTWEEESTSRNDQALNYWYGMSSGVIDLRLSEDLPAGTKHLATILQEGIRSGRIVPFEGRFVDRDGHVRQQSGRMSNEAIVGMDWLMDNVIGSIPRKKDLNPSAKSAVSVSGVIEK